MASVTKTLNANEHAALRPWHQGLRRALVTALTVTILACGLARQVRGQQKVYQRITSARYQDVFDELWPLGFRPSRVEVEVIQNVDYYSLVMEVPEEELDFIAKHGLDDEAFQNESRAHSERGFKLFIHRTCVLSGVPRHLAVWMRPSLNRPLGTIWNRLDEIPASGNDDARLAPLDQLMLGFLLQHQIPGGTLAVSRNGKLVYSRGFGYQDLESQTPMEPDTLMRIASVSKPLTGTAVMQLVSRNRLKLDDLVFREIASQLQQRSVEFDPRIGEITVAHLLGHRGGWDRKASFDPMFHQQQIAEWHGVPTPVDPTRIIQYMSTQPLDFAPGEKQVYSNFGYSVLGRAIERVSSMSYEEYVRREVLLPLGIERMQIGHTRMAELAPDEARYYPREGRVVPGIMNDREKDVPEQYGGWSLESLDAHGGWIASAEDLVKFASAFDDPDTCPLLPADHVRQMFAPVEIADQVDPELSGAKRFYGYGWKAVLFPDGAINSFHSGKLAGSQALLVRRWDGLNWAVLFNTDENPDGKDLVPLIDPLIHEAVNSVEDWPR